MDTLKGANSLDSQAILQCKQTIKGLEAGVYELKELIAELFNKYTVGQLEQKLNT